MNKQWLETHIALHSYDSPREEQANVLTHVLGALFSLLALILMERKLLGEGITSPMIILGYAVYGTSMLLMYVSSSLYHHIKPSNLKRVFRIMDHVNIYILIAGTYTPFCLIMDGERGIPLLALIWSLVVLGVIFKLVFWGRLKVLHTLIYLAMGWLVVFYLNDLQAVLPGKTLQWILAGGISYSVGTIFYASKKIPYYHALWHLFVLGGSVFFWIGIYLYVIPSILSPPVPTFF